MLARTARTSRSGACRRAVPRRQTATRVLNAAPSVTRSARFQSGDAANDTRTFVNPEDLMTGLEKNQYIAKQDGVDLFNQRTDFLLDQPFGTLAKPVLVPSRFGFRIVGCVGEEGDGAHLLRWHRVESDRPSICLDCAQVFKCVHVPDELWVPHSDKPYYVADITQIDKDQTEEQLKQAKAWLQKTSPEKVPELEKLVAEGAGASKIAALIGNNPKILLHEVEKLAEFKELLEREGRVDAFYEFLEAWVKDRYLPEDVGDDYPAFVETMKKEIAEFEEQCVFVPPEGDPIVHAPGEHH